MTQLDELNNLISQLDEAVRRLSYNGKVYANAEREYKISLSETALKLRQGDMAIGMIDKVIYGVKSVADKRFQRDVAEATYKANQEAINVYKLRIRILHEQIQQDYGMTKFQ